jgi:Acyl-CoA oxidase
MLLLTFSVQHISVVWTLTDTSCEQAFMAAVHEHTTSLPRSTHTALWHMTSLFGLYWMERDMGDFTEDRYIHYSISLFLHIATTI